MGSIVIIKIMIYLYKSFYNQFVLYNLIISFRSTRAKNGITQPLSLHDRHIQIYLASANFSSIFFHLRSIVSHRRSVTSDYFSATCSGPSYVFAALSFLIIRRADRDECNPSNEDGDTKDCTCLSQKQGARAKVAARAAR